MTTTPNPDDVAHFTAMRLAAGLSQRQAADLLGVTKSYVSHIEAGRRPLRQEHLDRFIWHVIGFRTSVYRIRAVGGGEMGYVDVRAVGRSAALQAAAALPEGAWES